MSQSTSPPRRRLLLVCPENLSDRETALAAGLAAEADLSVVVVTPGPAFGRSLRVPVIPVESLGSSKGQPPPGLVVYASPPGRALHWKVWRWKRSNAPGALLGGYWPRPVATWWARRMLDTLDFFLAEDEAGGAALRDAGVPPGRTLIAGSEPLAVAAVAAFLARRRAAEDRSVLWVDEDLSLHSPSTKHLVYSLPHLQAEGWEVRGWCLSADDVARAGMEIREFPPAPRWLRLFTPYWFFAGVNLHGIWQTILKGRPPARVVHAVGSAFLGADIAAIHFVHDLWLRKQIELRPRSRKAVLELLWTIPALLRDRLQYRNPRCRLLLPVSDSIAQAVRGMCLPTMRVEVLPNSYDESRFNPQVRARWRAPMRRELGFGDEDCVFCFASQGHYRRKGFWLAVDGLARLRAREKTSATRRARFLVVGGHEATLDGLRRELGRTVPGWEAWITFTGKQTEVERYLSAADAFLFPSYFEAFCLAEIETGALGLPLLLTAHPGTEMILRDGVNGRLLSYEPEKLTDALAVFLERGLPPFEASPGRALERVAYARALAEIYEREAGLDAERNCR